ncbi:MAG: diguanylate cyclase [Chloroflexi bacterium]|nr:diguanylate cyclase [Chloroflexota bacterium]
MAYIFVQAILLSSRFSKSFDRVETLSGELEDTNVSLQQSERKYRNIFEDSKDMIFIAGLDEQIEDVSPACEEVLGYTKSELLQMKVLDVIVDPEARSRFQGALTAQGSFKNFEVDLQRKDGLKIDALVTATLRQEKNGKVTGFQGSVRDITDRKQAEAERLRAMKLEQIAITDPLTKIYNRRFFNEAAEKEIERAKRSGSSLSVIVFDIDHFKNVNDTYGHSTGDQVLINIVNICKRNVRSMDLFARFGGEEFVIMMPETDINSAQETAQRLREIVAEKPITKSDKTDVSVTISPGIANWDSEKSLNILALLDRADQALYQSKEAGRNRVTIWGEGNI